MNKTLALMMLAGFMVGCSTPSEIALNDGQTIYSQNKPTLNEDTGFYVYKRPDGNDAQVNKDVVKEINPTLRSIR